MRLPRLRITVGWMMGIVAILSVIFALLGLWSRADRYATIMVRHDAALPALVASKKANPNDQAIARKVEWHIRMRDKYLQAASRPWLPVAPDPPEPE